MSRPSRTRAAFTLVELLVVIAVIGIFIALLLPAVQAAREAARRVHCSNNMKQIGLAVHGYHDVHKCFPPGHIWMGGGPNWAAGYHKTNWAIALLPYLEQEPLYDAYDHNAFNSDPVNKDVRETFLDVYACPSDGDGARGILTPRWGVAKFHNAQYQFGSYRGVAGRTDTRYYMVADRGHWSTRLGWTNHPRSWRGMFHIICPGLNGCERFSTVVDGSSNTLAVGETHRPENDDPADSRATYWAYSGESHITSTLYPLAETIRVRDYWDCVAQVPGGKGCQFGAWFSYHPGGISWLLCDGSVRHISVNVNMYTLSRLAGIADREPAQVP